MPVVPYRLHLLHDHKTLYQFFLACQQKSVEQNHPHIASISMAIEVVDPLATLQQVADIQQPHFYLENPFRGEAIAAFGAVTSFATEGKSRFETIQAYIQADLDHLSHVDGFKAGLDTPRFFCAFTFFDQPCGVDFPFPGATVFLPKWQVLRRHDSCIATANFLIQPHSNLINLTDEFEQQLQAIQQSSYGVFNISDEFDQGLTRWQMVDTHDFKSAVAATLKSIQQKYLNKLVLAHAVDVISHLPFQWISSLDNLRKLHPDCYIFSVGHGTGKTFIGASPERLISIGDRHLISDALAGSAPRGTTSQADAVLGRRLLQSPKERHEHQVVVDFLRDRLSQFGLTPQVPATPELLRLSNIQHLHTPITATLPPKLHPLELLADLHPTPAVAGMPRDRACEEIQRYEPFGRSLYAAPLGWVDAEGNAEFIVGIRSALIDGNHARLYAGAGIVAGSEPDRELAEVKLKLQALLRALV